MEMRSLIYLAVLHVESLAPSTESRMRFKRAHSLVLAVSYGKRNSFPMTRTRVIDLR